MVYYRHLFLLISLVAVLNGNLTAQERASVESKIYNNMLNGLLERNVPEMSADELVSLMGEVVLLDTREKEEFDVSHIKGAIYVGYDDFSMKSVKDLDKDSPIVVYCSVGYRSEKITQRLRQKGYTNVSNLFGGLFEWRNIDQPVVDLDGVPTSSVHAFDRVWGVWLHNSNKIY